MGFSIRPGIYKFDIDTSGSIKYNTGVSCAYPVAYSYCFMYDPKTNTWDRVPVNREHRLPDDLFEVK